MRWILRGIVLTALLGLALLAFAPQVIGLSKNTARSTTADDPLDDSLVDVSQSQLTADTDDVQQPGIYMSPLFDGLAKLSGQIADATQQDDLTPGASLAQADRTLADIKASNRTVLSDLQRPYRRVSPSTRHVILVTVSGLNQASIDRLPSETSYLHSMYEKGVRFTQYYSPVDRDAAWRHLFAGTTPTNSRASDHDLLARIWRSGYLTALIGDTTQAPPQRLNGTALYDFRFGPGNKVARDDEFAQQVSSNGKQIDLLASDDGSRMRTQDVMIHEAGAFIKENGRGRPFFMHLALDVTGPETENMDQRVAFLDSRMRGLFEFIEREKLNHRLIVVVAGLGLYKHDQQLKMQGLPAVTRMPLLLYWPDRNVRKIVSTHTATIDILPTIADLTDATIPSGLDGLPLVGPSSPEIMQESRTFVWPRQSENQVPVVLQQPWELILSDPPRLFDSVADPTHRRDLAGELPGVVEELRALTGIEL